MEEIKLFTYDYVTELQRNVEIHEKIDDYFLDVFPHKDKYPKGRTGVNLEKDVELHLPSDTNSFDIENSIILYESIQGMNPTIASDVRFWTYLTHVRFWNYMRTRWVLKETENNKGRIMDRYHLKQMNLAGLTRNGISRLWWYAYLTADSNRENKYELLHILLSRADISVSLLERSLGSNKNIRIAFLEFLADNEDIRTSEKLTRELLVQLNLIGGVKNIPFLTINEIKSYLDNIKKHILLNPQ